MWNFMRHVVLDITTGLDDVELDLEGVQEAFDQIHAAQKYEQMADEGE
jgi:hypothetical protein